MRKSLCVNSVFGILAVVIILGSVLRSSVDAHEAHKTQCTQTEINAIRGDIQVMRDGEHKRTAAKEMELAEERMAGKDMKSCVAHMHNAMEAIEK